MTDTKWLSEDEQEILERYEHEAQCGNIPLNYRVTFERLAAERERNAELVEERDAMLMRAIAAEEDMQIAEKRNAELVEALGLVHSCTMTGLCKHCRKTIDAAVAKNGGKP